MKRVVLLLLVAGAFLPDRAEANGRRPTAVDVHFHPGDDNWILGAMTFGFLLSTDGGETFDWVCEDAACPGDPDCTGEPGCNGCDTFDPVYAITESGVIFNTTIFELHVSRDGGCEFAAVGGDLAGRYSSDVVVDVDGNVWTLTSDGAFPNDVYFSDDDGVTFTQRNLHIDVGWFENIRIAPSDTQRVYVSGKTPDETLFFRSDDRGATWTPVVPNGIPAGKTLYLEVVSLTDPDLMLARVPEPGDDIDLHDIYRTTDGGDNWTNVLSLSIETFFDTDPRGLARVAALSNGDYLAGSPAGGLLRSTDGGQTWNATADEPRTWCVRQAADGTIYACSENWDPEQMLDPSVRAAIVESTDADSWSHVLRFSGIFQPKQCPAGTIQADFCAAERWCMIAAMFGIMTGPDCGLWPDAGPEEPPPVDSHPKGCGCSTTAVASMFLVIPPLFRRRRNRTPTPIP